jgi:hypothetical protein
MVVTGEVIQAGQPVYVNQIDASAYRADATSDASSQVCGFCQQDTVSGGMAAIVPVGCLELADWSVPLGFAAGSATLLVPGAVYYLSVTGQITASSPASGFVIQVGIAVTPTTLDIDIKTRVRL